MAPAANATLYVQVGGTPAVLKYLDSKGYINRDCMTVTGSTMGTNLGQVPELRAGQDVVLPMETPIKETGEHACVLIMHTTSAAAQVCTPQIFKSFARFTQGEEAKQKQGLNSKPSNQGLQNQKLMLERQKKGVCQLWVPEGDLCKLASNTVCDSALACIKAPDARAEASRPALQATGHLPLSSYSGAGVLAVCAHVIPSHTNMCGSDLIPFLHRPHPDSVRQLGARGQRGQDHWQGGASVQRAGVVL